MKTTVFIVAASAALLVGCPLPERNAPPPPEMLGDPPVTNVKVAGGYIVIDQEPIVVHNANATIVWRISTAGYDFPADGIVFKGPTNDQFFDCAPRGPVFQCKDKKTVPGLYRYTIKVVASGGLAAPQPLDPSIMNN